MFLNDTITQVSPHIIIDDDTGYMTCLSVIMGRTGIQKYYGRELGKEFLQEFDNDGSLGFKDKIFNVIRNENEVFDSESLSSLENKPFVLHHPKNKEMVDINNYLDFSKGFCRNIRKELDSETNQEVIKGDVIITDSQVKESIINKALRETSLGYDCKLKLIDNDNVLITNIRYNHCALVYKGRAGIAKIIDSIQDSHYNKNLKKGENMEKKSLFERIFNKKISDSVADELLKDNDFIDDSNNIISDETNNTKNKIEEKLEEKQEIIEKKDETKIDDENKEVKEEVKENDCSNSKSTVSDSLLENKEIKENKNMNINLSLDEINALPDGKTKSALLDSYKDSKDELEDAVKPNTATVINDTATLFDTARNLQREKQMFYSNKLNPHKNPSYLKECLSKSDIEDYLSDFQYNK